MRRKNTKTAETWTDREGKAWPVEITYEDGQPALVKFGRGRTTIEYYRTPGYGRCSCECYSDPEDFFSASRWWSHDHAERRDPGQFEGVPFIDMRAAVETEAGYKMVIGGPMCDVNLPEGEVDRLCEPDPLFASAMIGNRYGGLLTLQKVSRLAGLRAGPLDSVSVGEYCRLWREAGATVGVIRNGQFVIES